jgi:hypothetical protein
MNSIKQFRTSLIVLGLFLVFVPILCHADMSIGYLIYNPPLLIIVAIMGVWIIEAMTIKNRLEGIPQKALFTALIVNLITILLGVLLSFFVKNITINYILPYQSLVLLCTFLFISIFVEAAVLRLYYKTESWSKIISTSVSMNIKSYLFLIAFLISEFILSFGIIIAVIVIPFFFLKSFDFLISGKELSKFSRIVSKILIFIISLILIVLVVNGVQKAIDRANFRKRAGPHVQADMAQIRSIAEMIYDDDKSYINVSCNNDKYNLKEICSDIEKYAETKVIMNTSENEYCAYVELKALGEWACMDSSGWNSRNTKNPATSGFCSGQTFTCPH